MADTLYTNSFTTAISDIGHDGGAITELAIGDKKIIADISNQITEIDPEQAPFMRFLEALGSKAPCSHWKFEWMEQDRKDLAGTINDSGTSIVGSDTEETLVVDESDLYIAGDLLMFIDTSAGTSEIVKVSSKTNSTTYEVTRGYSGTTALDTLADGDEVIRIGNAFAENTQSADPDSIEPSWYYNVCQNFKASVAISNRFDSMNVRGFASEIQMQLQSRMRSMMEGMEGAFLFGERSYESSSNSLTTTGGLKYFIHTYASSTNEHDASSSTFNQLYLDNLANDLFRYGSSKKLALVSGKTLSKITTFALPYLRENKESSKKLGCAVTDYTSPHGTLSLVHSRLLEKSDVWNKYMFIVDPQFVKKRYINGRDTRIRTNVQENDRDGKKHEIIADCGLEVRNVKAHHLITGIDNDIS